MQRPLQLIYLSQDNHSGPTVTAICITVHDLLNIVFHAPRGVFQSLQARELFRPQDVKPLFQTCILTFLIVHVSLHLIHLLVQLVVLITQIIIASLILPL